MSAGTIAIVGASTDRRKYGNIAVRAYIEQGWMVYPVNPNAAEVEGLTAYASIRDVPAPLDRVSVYLPPDKLVGELANIAAKDPGEVWLNPGTESAAVLAEARRLGLNIIQACSIVEVGSSPEEYR